MPKPPGFGIANTLLFPTHPGRFLLKVGGMAFEFGNGRKAKIDKGHYMIFWRKSQPLLDTRIIGSISGAYDPRIKQWLGLAPEDHIVAFVYLGFPAIPKVERHPTHFEEKTTWLGWEE